MNILVTGAKGQLGSDLVPLLNEKGHGIIAPGSGELDITDLQAVKRAVNENRPEIIINCAAYTKVDMAEIERDRAFAVNSQGAANIAKAAKEAGAALIHISTDFVFDGLRSTPYSEGDGVNPLGAYGSSKLEGEEEVRAALDEHIIIRTSWLYGMEGGNFVKTILHLASEREALRIVYDQAGCPTWTRDLAGVIASFTEAVHTGEVFGTYHYSNEGVASWYDFATAIIEEAILRGATLRCGHIEPILTQEYPAPAKRPPYSVMDKGKVKKTLGIPIPHWRASLRSMLNALLGSDSEAVNA